MSKKRVAPTKARTQTGPPSETAIACSKAKAALWLLDHLQGQHLLVVDGPLSQPTQALGFDLDTREVRGWITDECLDMLADSIRAIEKAEAKQPPKSEEAA